MTTTSPAAGFAASFVSLLPDARAVTGQPSEFWSAVRVPTDRVLREAIDPAQIAPRFAYPFGNKMLQALCAWLGLLDPGTRDQRVQLLTNHLAANREAPCCRDLLYLLRFLHRRRRSAIAMVGSGLAPEEVGAVIEAGQLSEYSTALAYAMYIYYHQPSHLRLVMEFEETEPLGYRRHSLAPKRFHGRQRLTEEEVSDAVRRIEQGVDLRQIDSDTVNAVMEGFEARRPRQVNSTCPGVYHDDASGSATVFILREVGEAFIPEVDRTIFGDEAGHIMLRFHDALRVLEEHSHGEVGTAIAAALAADLLGTAHVEYVADEEQTQADHLIQLLRALRRNSDRVLRLREVDVKHAPIDRGPRLILRCDKGESLSVPLDFLQERGIDLTAHLDDLSTVGIVMERPVTDGDIKPYIMRVTLDRVVGRPDRYVVRYYQRGVPAPYRRFFEEYLLEHYDVAAIPATGR